MKDALDRAIELLATHDSELPLLAKKYKDHLYRKLGAFAEVALTAFAHYAQEVEKLSCADAAYRTDFHSAAWFGANTL